MDAEVRCEDCGFSFHMAVARIREQATLSCPQCRSHQLAITWRQPAPTSTLEPPPPPAEPYAPLDKIVLDPEPKGRPDTLPPVDRNAPPPAFVTHEVIFDDAPDPPEPQAHAVIFDDPPAPSDAPVHEMLFDDPPPDASQLVEILDSVEEERPPLFELTLSLAGPDMLAGLSLLMLLCLCLALTVIHPFVGAVAVIPALVSVWRLRNRVYRPRDAALRRAPRRETEDAKLSERARTALCAVTLVACILLTVLIVLCTLP
jgi:hypothetical protein